MDKIKTLYRYIKDDYDMNAALESATRAIAKRRSKQHFPKEKAVKVYMVLVYKAKSVYNRNVTASKRLSRFTEEDRKAVAEALYKDESKTIGELTKYYKKKNQEPCA